LPELFTPIEPRPLSHRRFWQLALELRAVEDGLVRLRASCALASQRLASLLALEVTTPALGGWTTMPDHVFGDRRLGDPGIIRQQAAKVPFTQDDDMVQAFASNRSDQTFDMNQPATVSEA
jgi:hypothetical protein